MRIRSCEGAHQLFQAASELLIDNKVIESAGSILQASHML